MVHITKIKTPYENVGTNLQCISSANSSSKNEVTLFSLRSETPKVSLNILVVIVVQIEAMPLQLQWWR